MPPEARTIRSPHLVRHTRLRRARRPRPRAAAPDAAAAGQPGRRSSSSGRAMQSSRSGAPVESSAVDSTSSRNVSSPHWMSSKQTTSGACASSSFRNPQAISSVPASASVSPSSERIALAACSSLGHRRASCFTTSIDRPVRDPLAVGEAAAAHHPRVDLLERLRHEPRLADARVADDRHELAARTGQRAIPGVRELLQLALAADEAGSVRALCGFADRERAGTRRPARSSPSARAAAPRRPRPRHRRARASRRRSAPRPAPPPAPAAPRRSPRHRSRAAPPCP